MESVRQRLVRVIAQEFRLDPLKITPEFVYVQLIERGSGDTDDFLTALEDEFFIIISEDELYRYPTIKSLVPHIRWSMRRPAPDD